MNKTNGYRYLPFYEEHMKKCIKLNMAVTVALTSCAYNENLIMDMVW